MPAHKAPPLDHDHEEEVTLFGLTNFRNQERKFGIKTDDRRRHMYVIGKTGMGKSTVLENMVVSDINAGHGLAYIDPHGDTAEKLLDFIPAHRINDVVYFNPADMDFPVGFNILEISDETQKHLVAAGLMGVFKKIWPDVWSSRMEYILLNTIMALLDFPGSTLLGINRLLSDEEYRSRVVSLIQDPVVKTFWVKEFASFSEKYRTEAVAPLQNKVGQFLSATIIRNIVAQVKSTIDIREIMDTRKIFIVNLAKGRIGEENSRLLGAMIITRIQLAAMERVDMPEKERQDFYLYVDEFQNFATESFANILSEARKYRLNLIVAHQYIEQLDELVRAAIFGNVGSILAFRVGAADAMFMEQEFMPRFTPEDLVNLRKYEVYLKLMIDGASSEPFSAKMLPPIAQNMGMKEKVIKVSRERYAMTRKGIEDKVIKWAGYGTADTGQKLLAEDEIDEEEAKLEELIKEREASSPNVGEMAKPSDGGGFGAKKKKKAMFQVPCAVDGEMQDLTFEPDWTKPWFCKKHLEMKQNGTLPKGIKLRPASDFKPGPDGQMPAASFGASAAASAAPAPVAPAPTPEPEPAPAPAPAPAPIPPAPRPVTPPPSPAPRPPSPPPAPRPAAPAPRPPAPKPSTPAPAPKPPAPVAAAPAPAPAPIPPAPRPVTPSPAPAPRPVTPPSAPSLRPPATPAAPAPKPPAPTPAPAPRPSSPPPAAPRKPMPDPSVAKIEDGPVIPMASHKPRIVLSTGADDEKDVLLVPPPTTPPPAPAPAAETGPKQEPEPFAPPPDDESTGGTLQPGQVIKF